MWTGRFFARFRPIFDRRANLFVWLAVPIVGVLSFVTLPSYGQTTGDPTGGRHVAGAKCAACHGPDGNSPDTSYPKLAGQNPVYLYWQMWAFKTGQRPSDVMSQIAAGLSDKEIADLASFYAGQGIKRDKESDTALIRAGQRIFYSHGPGRIPPCAACHNSGRETGVPMMMGRMPMTGMMGGRMMGRGGAQNVPYIDGQHADYLVEQLNQFATGQHPSRIMTPIAAAMTAADRKAVAAFLSSVP